jgi:hypothetical protein
MFLEWEPELNEDVAMQNMMNPKNKRKAVEGKLRSSMSYIEQCAAVGASAAEVPPGKGLIGNKEPLVSLCVVDDAAKPGAEFVVIFSVSHVIVDGFTYYKLLSMLSSEGTVAALNPTRKEGVVETTKQMMGEAEFAIVNSGGLICNVVCSMLCGSKPTVAQYFIDKDRVEEEKKSLSHGVSFVSTNDVLTSAFGVATNARIMLMPINFRDRRKDFTSDDAGNYEGALVFVPADYSEPSLIRKTLESGPPTFLRGGGGAVAAGTLPGGCEAMRMRISMITNWTFPHFSELSIAGCQHVLHSPHTDCSLIPFDLAVVYSPRKGETAVSFFTRSIDEKGLVAELPLGGKVK